MRSCQAKVGVKNCGRLAEYFDVRVLRLGESDRSNFGELIDLAVRELDDESGILIGESMGGVTALGVALERPDLTRAVIVANPATSYSRAPISSVAPLLPRIPGELYSSLPAIVTPLFGKPGWFDGLIEDGQTPPRNAIEDVLRRSNALSTALPASALEWRERELVREGARRVNAKIAALGGYKPAWGDSAIFVGGGRDVILPSVDECRRLESSLGGRVVVEARAAHVMLDDLDLIELVASLGLVRQRRISPSAADISLEPKSIVERLVRLASRFVAPVFFSTDRQGCVHRGLSNVPIGEYPIVLCGNHQLFGLDGPLIVEAFLRQRKALIPSLVHPALLQDASPLSPLPYPLRGTAAMLRRFGSLPAGGRNLLAALRSPAKAVLLFPGGAREVFKRKDERYVLSWPDDASLVKVAARLNATIVPFSAVGADDGIGDIVADSDEILNLPLVGDFFRNRTANLPSFVPGDVFVPPLLVPRPQGPRRMYFLFHQPVDTSLINHDDDASVRQLYFDIQLTVERGIHRLIDARNKDPFEANLLARLSYQAAVGKPPPAFDL